MNICRLGNQYQKQIAQLAYAAYQKECSAVNELSGMKELEFLKEFQEMLENAEGFVALEDEMVVGYIWGYPQTNGNIYVPLGAFVVSDCKDREKTISRLFQAYAEEICKSGTYHYDIKVFAHDEEMVRKLSLLQFGIESECGVYERTIFNEEKTQDNGIAITNLSTEEVLENWTPIWAMVKEIIDHLKESPIFYKGEEFTEEIYKEFLSDADTNVFVAKKQEEYIGIIETNTDKGDLFINHLDNSNVGEIYVKNEYRKTGISHRLLLEASEYEYGKGNPILWVEHGTANPNAMGFWDTYFKPYCYSMIRDICL